MSNLVKAIQIEENGGPEVLKLVEIEVPAPGENEITIRQHAAGLNFIDIYFRTGLYKSAMPTGLGFEGAGEVIAVGKKAAKRFKKGDRVAYGQSPIVPTLRHAMSQQRKSCTCLRASATKTQQP